MSDEATHIVVQLRAVYREEKPAPFVVEGPPDVKCKWIENQHTLVLIDPHGNHIAAYAGVASYSVISKVRQEDQLRWLVQDFTDHDLENELSRRKFMKSVGQDA